MKNTQTVQNTEGHHFTRIERILDYIHNNIDQALTVESLAKQSCWSRWQLQRIFLQETQQTVAQYVREIKLSLAAEQLLLDKTRVMDISLNCGFSSEVSFVRAFKQLFHCTPSAYRKRGHRIGLKTPLISTLPVHQAYEIKKRLLQIRFEHAEPFHFYGVGKPIKGLFEAHPNYSEVIPTVWYAMMQLTGLTPPFKQPVMGIVDTRTASNGYSTYWAGYKVSSEQQTSLPPQHIVNIPAQSYAVIPHIGIATHLDRTLRWFLSDWLPQSQYQAVEGFDLEIYQAGFDHENKESDMECWIPIQPKSQ